LLPLNGTGSVDLYGKQRFEVYEKNSLEKRKGECGFSAEDSKDSEEFRTKRLDAHKKTDEKTTALLEKMGIIETVNKGLDLAQKTYNGIKTEIKENIEDTATKTDLKALKDKINTETTELKNKLEKMSFKEVYPFCSQNSTKTATDDIIDTVKSAEKISEEIEELDINEQNLHAATQTIEKKSQEIEKSKEKAKEAKKELEKQISEISKEEPKADEQSGEDIKQDAVKAIMKNPEESIKAQVKSLESDVILALINVIR